MQRVPRLVQVAHEVADAALVVVLDHARLGAPVDQPDDEALEEGGLAEALREGLEVEVRLLEDLGVRQEAHRGAGAPGASPERSTGPSGSPAAKRWTKTPPSRWTSATSHSDRRSRR